MQKACCLPGLQDFFRKAKEVRGPRFVWVGTCQRDRCPPSGPSGVTCSYGRRKRAWRFEFSHDSDSCSLVQGATCMATNTVVGTPDIQITASGRAFGGRIRNMANKLFT